MSVQIQYGGEQVVSIPTPYVSGTSNETSQQQQKQPSQQQQQNRPAIDIQKLIADVTNYFKTKYGYAPTRLIEKLAQKIAVSTTSYDSAKTQLIQRIEEDAKNTVLSDFERKVSTLTSNPGMLAAAVITYYAKKLNADLNTLFNNFINDFNSRTYIDISRYRPSMLADGKVKIGDLILDENELEALLYYLASQKPYVTLYKWCDGIQVKYEMNNNELTKVILLADTKKCPDDKDPKKRTVLLLLCKPGTLTVDFDMRAWIAGDLGWGATIFMRSKDGRGARCVRIANDTACPECKYGLHGGRCTGITPLFVLESFYINRYTGYKRFAENGSNSKCVLQCFAKRYNGNYAGGVAIRGCVVPQGDWKQLILTKDRIAEALRELDANAGQVSVA